MNINSMKDVLKISHLSGDAVHLIGKHGIGKTQIVKRFAEEQGFHCEVLQLTVMDTGDLLGMPVIEDTKHGKVTTWAKPVWLQRINQANEAGKDCIVFMDELGRASIDIRQAALQIVLEGKVQEHTLGLNNGNKTLVVVADNPSGEYDTADFDSALEDRFTSMSVETHINDFLNYAREVDILPVITDYLTEYSEKLHFTPEDDGENVADGKGSTPRAWEKLSDILKNTPKDSELIYPLITAKVGTVVGSSFFHWFNNYSDIVSVDDIKGFLKDTKIKTELQQRKAADKLKTLTGKIEVLAVTELIEKMYVEYRKDKTNITAELIAVTLASLPLEVCVGILKTWRVSTDEAKSEFYFIDLQDATPKHWLLADISQLKTKAANQ